MIHKRFLRSWVPTLALVALLLASCGKDDPGGTEPDGTTAGGGDIRFEIGFAPQTRAATDTDFNATWEDGDQIGIFAVASGQPLAASGNYIHNVRLKYSGGTWSLDSGVELYWPSGGGSLDFYAYHPYSAAATNPTSIAFNVKTDQSAETEGRSNYNLSDLLTAKPNNSGNGYGKGETVPLTFSHALAMVQVTLTDDREAVGDISVSLLGVKTASTLNLGGQTVTAGGDPQTVNMYRMGETAAGEPIFRALVPAQTVPGNYKFLLEQFNELYDAEGADELTAGEAEKHSVEMPD